MKNASFQNPLLEASESRQQGTPEEMSGKFRKRLSSQRGAGEGEDSFQQITEGQRKTRPNSTMS